MRVSVVVPAYNEAGRIGAVLDPIITSSLIDEVIVVELSYSAQFYKYLQTFLDLPWGHTYVYKRSGGKNLTVGEVEDKIKRVVRLGQLRREVLV